MDPSERPAQPSSTSELSGAEAPPLFEPIDVPHDRGGDGRFRVETLHASGGMGNIFVAKDEQLNRSVALKEIQDRFADDPQIRERFLREAEVTGQLEHPGIVPVYALGRYTDGRPYYVMRMIRGDSLKRAIAALHNFRGDERAYHLELRRLLNRFVTACNTLEYAHSRGVVHRDLKPDNILLGPYGETLVVDWGLAKLVHSSDVRIDASAGNERLVPSPVEATQAGTITGTPAYMSPEQALGWQDAIKPASDIYSLGATLYTLLTGRVPIGGDDDLGTLIARIQKQDFCKPRELNPSIPRPLEAICLKAMARSMSARYASAAELAADIEAFLADEPVSAWKEPATVRAARWVRRHRTLVSTGGATAMVAILALATLAFVQNSANRRLNIANDRETAARKEAESERDKAEHNFQMAQSAVDRYFTQVSEDRRLAAHGLEPLRRDLLNSAGQFYERLVAKDASKGTLKYESAWAKFRIASITEEISSPADAVRNFETAAESFRALAKVEGGTSPRSREGILFCEINLSELFERMGQHAKAKQSLDGALSIARSIVSEFPNLPSGKHFLARCLGAQAQLALEAANLAAANTAYRDEIQIREQIVQSQSKSTTPAQQQTFQVELSGAYRNLAVVEQRYEHLDEARMLLEKSLEIDRRLAHDNPEDGFLQHMLARTLTQAGDAAARAGRSEDAQKAYREAVDMRIALVQDHPDVLEYRASLATTADNFAVFCYDRGEFDLSQKYFEHALAQSERLVSDYPNQPDYQSSLALALVNAAVLREAKNQFPLAERWLARAFQIRTKLLHEAPNDADRQEQLASVCLSLGIVETDTRHGEQAGKHLRSSIVVFQRLVKSYPDRPFFSERLGASLKQLADLFKTEQRNDQAITTYQEALELQRKLVAARPAVLQHHLDLASVCINLGNLRNRLAQAALARTAFAEAIEVLPRTAGAKIDGGTRPLLEKAYTGRGLALESLGDLTGMAADFERAVALAPPARVRILRFRCARSLLEGKQFDLALTIAGPLAVDTGLHGQTAFDLSSSLFRAVGAIKAEKSKPPKDPAALIDRIVHQGLRFLTRADEAGYFGDPAHRKQLLGPPFVPLLEHESVYRKLVEATSKAGLTKETAPRK
jgi:eukaryotic-like serine/threonine-protein kinase